MTHDTFQTKSKEKFSQVFLYVYKNKNGMDSKNPSMDIIQTWNACKRFEIIILCVCKENIVSDKNAMKTDQSLDTNKTCEWKI